MGAPYQPFFSDALIYHEEARQFSVGGLSRYRPFCSGERSGYMAAYTRGCFWVTRLTAKFMNDIRAPEKGQVIYRDDELKGFGLRVTKGSMSWIAELKIGGKTSRRTIGSAEALSPEQARKEAQRILAEMSVARQEPRSTLKVPTLAEVLALYPTKKTLRESTITNYRQVVRRYLSEWEALPVTQITKEMVFAKHRELGERVSGNYANLIMQVLRTLLYFAMEHYEGADGHSIIQENPVSRISKNQMWYRKRRRQGVIADHQLSDWYVFPGRHEGHMVSPERQLEKIRKQARCPFMLHDCRRTFISMAAKLGVQHHLTKQLLNHIGDRDDTDSLLLPGTISRPIQ